MQEIMHVNQLHEKEANMSWKDTHIHLLLVYLKHAHVHTYCCMHHHIKHLGRKMQGQSLKKAHSSILCLEYTCQYTSTFVPVYFEYVQ